MLRSGGYELIDYGITNTECLVDNAIDDNIELLLFSTLMLPSALNVKKVISNVKDKNSDIKIVVGEAPFRFDDKLWKYVGADAMCKNSSEIIKTISELFNS